MAISWLTGFLDFPADVSAHLDLSVDDVAAEVVRHTALGATVIRDADWWTTLRDPAGLVYCVTPR
jgi:hypothetical protein